MYGSVAADHLKQPRNLGRIGQPDGVGHADEPATDTFVTVYLRLSEAGIEPRTVHEARFRAFGCGGCIIAGSVLTVLMLGQPLVEAASLYAAAIHAALEDGLPEEQRYCVDLAVRALKLALQNAGV